MKTPAIAVIASLCLMCMPFCHVVLAGDSSVDRSKERVLENTKGTGLNSDTPPPEIKQTPEPGPAPVLQDFGQSRPGYRPTVTKFSQEFYRYIMDKAGRGETISQSESIMIQYMISTRSWPEAPKINSNDEAAAKWIAQHDTIVANAMEGLRSSGGKLDYDMERPKLVEQFRNYYFSLPPDKRNWVSNRMMDYFKSLGYDMRSDQVKDTDRKRIEDRERKDKEAKDREKKRKDIEQANKKAQDQAAKDKQVFDDWKAKEARERLTKAIKDSKADGPKKKSWDEMTSQERRDSLKNNDPKAWDKIRDALSGNKKAGQEVIEAIESGKPKDSSQPYNPLNDPNLKTKKTPVDLTDAKRLIDDFQKGQWKPLDSRDQKIKDQQPGQPQSPDYLGTTSASTTSTGTSGGSTTTTTAGSGSTSTADKTGIEVVVVGEAPPGKCRIVEGQLVPVKGYKENISGMTVSLTGPENKSVVSSGSGTFSFPEIQAGDYVVSVKEWNYGMTKQNFAAPSGKSVKIVLKGSCPYLYVWDGERYQQENDIYSVARLTHWDLLPPEARMLASREGLAVHPVFLSDVSAELRRERSYRDYYKITKPLRPDGNGQYRLQIREQASEYSWTDLTGLLAVDHIPGSQVAVTRQGDLLLHGELQPVNSFADLNGKGFAAMPAEGLPLYNGEGLVFDLAKEAFSSGLLEVRWQGFQDGTAEGHEASQGVPKLSLERLDTEGNWQLMDYGYPRDEIQKTHFLLAPGSGGPMTTRMRLVAESCIPEKYHRIDGISWGKHMEDEPRVNFLNLLSAKNPQGEEVTATLESGDGQSVLMGPGESLELWFTGAPVSAGDERSFVFVSEGAYMPMPYMNVAAGK